MLQLTEISYRRGREQVLDKVSLTVPSQRITGLAGPNGGGKSTLFEIIAGLRRESAGQIEGRDRHRMAYLPQEFSLPASLPLSVADFLEMSQWFDRRPSPAISIKEVIERLNLGRLLPQRLAEISGGERKQILLARSLCQPADLFLLDEPFNALDMGAEETVGHLLKDLVREKGKTFLIISHDWHAMNHFFDSLILLNRRVLAQGSVAEMARLYFNLDDPKRHEWMHR